MEWKHLHDKFVALSKITEATKLSSYSMDVSFSYDGTVTVHLGTYDISDWPRHTYLGPFNSEQEAYKATAKKIEEARIAVENEANQA